MKLADKVAIITGASSGIGKACARLFASEGARVVLADINDQGGQETMASIRAAGHDAVFVHTDVSVASDVARLTKAAIASYARIDILLNVAGIYMARMPVENIEESLWDRIYSTNVKSAFLGARFVVPEMKRAGSGTIVNLGSMAALRPSSGLTAYSSSKGALITFTRALAVELTPHNIRVNCICPTLTDTPMIKVELAQIQNRPGPRPKLVKPEDVAGVALFLASSDSSMMTGACIEVNGGQLM